MSRSTAEIVVAGAGIAGVSAAFQLAVRERVNGVVLVEAGDPLALTSDKSTECYRNWWPGPGDAMVAFMNRSIDLLERIEHESGGRIHLNRRGYLFATADPARVDAFRTMARDAQSLGGGEMRVHDGSGSPRDYVRSPARGFEGVPPGADLITDPALIRTAFPYLDPAVVAVLHPPLRMAERAAARHVDAGTRKGARRGADSGPRHRRRRARWAHSLGIGGPAGRRD